MAKEIQVTIYPTSAPTMEEVVYDVDSLQEISYVCENLFMTYWPLQSYDRSSVNAHFESLHKMVSFIQHVEILLPEGYLQWEALLQELSRLLPQFVWVRIGRNYAEYGRSIYYLEFVPLVKKEEGFPFDILLHESIKQQLDLNHEHAVDSLTRRMEEIISRDTIWLDEEQLETQSLKEKVMSELREPGSQPTNESPVLPKRVGRKRKRKQQQKGNQRQKLFSPELSDEQQMEQQAQTNELTVINSELENKLLLYQEEIKRDKYTKERMKVANQKLEMMMDKLELAMVYGGLNYFDNHEDESEDEDWNRMMKVSLREYSYLIQKAKYLEQMWQLNGQLVQKTEKMTVSGNKLIYERDLVNKVKESFTSSEVYLVLDESKLIESRVRIKGRPLIGKPYVKIMKMDYNSLLTKGAYFDLLQSDNYFLEKMSRSSGRLESVAD